MALVDLHARLLQVNAALCTLTGLSPNDLLAKTLLEITYHDDRSVVDSRLRSLRNGDSRTYGAEHRLTHSDGYAVWVSFNASLVTIGPGKPLYLLAQVEDISERKRLEEQLRATR